MHDTARVQKEHVISIEYTLTDNDGRVVDSNAGQEALDYLHGHGQIVSGLEQQLDGMGVGDRATLVVAPEDGYGEHDPSQIFTVPRSQFGFEVEAGEVVRAEHPDGQAVPLQVLAVDAEKVTLDGNHPMAGKTLHFDVKVLAVRPATAEEIEHSHAH